MRHAKIHYVCGSLNGKKNENVQFNCKDNCKVWYIPHIKVQKGILFSLWCQTYQIGHVELKLAIYFFDKLDMSQENYPKMKVYWPEYYYVLQTIS